MNTEARTLEWKLPQRTLPIGKRTLVMGIINLTPDSFSKDGLQFSFKRAWARAERMIEDGVDIIDIGGESTRPGASQVSAEAEIRRVAPFLDFLVRYCNAYGKGKRGIPFSIDTTKAEVARVALGAGVEIVNDISGLRFDPEIAGVAAEAGAGLVLMHSRGTFETMHTLAPVADIMTEVTEGLQRSIAVAAGRGVERERIVLDPGIGFSKSQKQNIELIARLDQLGREFPDFPLLVGTSRKSFVGHLLEGATVDKRIHGTMATVAAAVLRGAHLVRVHDVRPAVQTLRVIDAIKHSGP
ncbi:MAG TPA: dihydropteroate synthase [Pyrinomonadaceae bacterium]|jgi:dihydropteroate synthase